MPFNDGYVEASKIIPKDITYTLPVFMNTAGNCKSNSSLTYCSLGIAREFVNDDGTKENVWMELNIISDKTDIGYLSDNPNKLHATYTKYHILNCSIDNIHVEEEK